jgi:hypothetical protein
MLLTPQDSNAIQKNQPMTGRKNGAYTRDIDITKIKLFSKANNCTVNDTIAALLSCSLHSYFQNH